MTIRSRTRQGAVLLSAAAVAASLAGCTTEYHGHDSGIDDALWLQIIAFEYPLSPSIYDPLDPTIGILHTIAPQRYPAAIDDPVVYLAGIDAPRWDGKARSIPELELQKGGAILYDVATTELKATFSIFIASGPRPSTYDGPSEVYTCFGFDVSLAPHSDATAHRTEFSDCPAELVAVLADDAAFASAEVFDG